MNRRREYKVPFFNDGYQTTIGSMFEAQAKKTELALKEALIKSPLKEVTLGVAPANGVNLIFVTGLYSEEAEIPLFTHPISFFTRDGKSYLACDLRLYIRKIDGGFQSSKASAVDPYVKNQTEYNFAKSRAILNLAWISGGANEIRAMLPFAGTVFAAWISELVARAYALDFKDQMVLAIIASYYYQSLFSNEQKLDEEAKQKLAVHTIKATNAPSKLVFEVFDKITPMAGIEDFCTNVRTILENVRLEHFNSAVLLTVVKFSWYGTNAKEFISIALEHPPTWIAMVFTALNEKTFKTSIIYRVAERFGKRGAADGFLSSYNNIVRVRLDVANEAIDDAPVVFKDFED